MTQRKPRDAAKKPRPQTDESTLNRHKLLWEIRLLRWKILAAVVTVITTIVGTTLALVKVVLPLIG